MRCRIYRSFIHLYIDAFKHIYIYIYIYARTRTLPVTAAYAIPSHLHTIHTVPVLAFNTARSTSVDVICDPQVTDATNTFKVLDRSRVDGSIRFVSIFSIDFILLYLNSVDWSLFDYIYGHSVALTSPLGLMLPG